MPPVSRGSPWQKFCAAWGGGCGSGICPQARRVVLARGALPCDVLLVGEAPGESENVIGLPFVGPAGLLQDEIVERALGPRSSPLCSYAFTNLVGCIPRYPDPDTGELKKFEQPRDLDVKRCMPRLQHFVCIADPRVIVCLGSVARKWLMPPSALAGARARVSFHRLIPVVHTVHPAYIIRASLAQRDLLVQRSIVVIRNAAHDYVLDGDTRADR